MIRLNGKPIRMDTLSLSIEQQKVFSAMEDSSYYYHYENLDELLFELLIRENIIKASYLLNNSKVNFDSFWTSKFNPLYWMGTETGYLLRPFIPPSIAIEDIFINGQAYGFECSTAIIVIYYKAVLNSIKRSSFDYLFQNLKVWDWNYDEDLGIITRLGKDFIPGDVVYFYNPDFKEPIWTGENAVFLGNNLFFGHGIGIKTANEMIAELNTLRRPFATRSAFLLDQHSRLNIKHLAQFMIK